MGLWHTVTQCHRLQCGAGGTDLDLRENALHGAALLQHGETPLCVGCWMVAMWVSAEQLLCAHPMSQQDDAHPAGTVLSSLCWAQLPILHSTAQMVAFLLGLLDEISPSFGSSDENVSSSKGHPQHFRS